MAYRFVLMCSLLLAPLVLVTTGVAQSDLYQLRSVDTSSPRSSLQGFLDEMHAAYEYIQLDSPTAQQKIEMNATRQRIIRCMDLSEIPEAVRGTLATEAAVCLKEVLDRIQLPPQADWPDALMVEEQELVRWKIPNTDLRIERVEEGPRAGEFLFSAETVELAPGLFDLVKTFPYVDRPTTTPGCYDLLVSDPGWMIPLSWIPDWSRRRIGGQAIWQWLGLAATLAATTLLMLAIYILGRRRAQGFRGRIGRYITTLHFPLIAMLVPLAAKYFIIEQLNIYGDLGVTVAFVLQTLFLFALVVLVVSFSNRLAEILIATQRIHPAGFDAQLARLGCRLGGILGAAVVVLERDARAECAEVDLQRVWCGRKGVELESPPLASTMAVQRAERSS